MTPVANKKKILWYVGGLHFECMECGQCCSGPGDGYIWVTRPEIEAIRGVNSDGVLRTLLSKGLVEEVGRLDSVGHPALFGITFEFLRFFGLESTEDLPELEDYLE